MLIGREKEFSRQNKQFYGNNTSQTLHFVQYSTFESWNNFTSCNTLLSSETFDNLMCLLQSSVMILCEVVLLEVDRYN